MAVLTMLLVQRLRQVEFQVGGRLMVVLRTVLAAGSPCPGNHLLLPVEVFIAELLLMVVMVGLHSLDELLNRIVLLLEALLLIAAVHSCYFLPELPYYSLEVTF